MRIMLIAGHGGSPYDAGAVSNGYTEAVETRRMANAVAPLLRSYGFDVVLYDQSKDAFKVVQQGGSLPLSGVDYVLEFHLNAAANDLRGNGRTTGSEIFVHTTEAGTGVESAILRGMAALGLKNRGVKRTNSFAVLRHVKKRGVSHALIETCFIDDIDDMDIYKTKFTQLAQAIADGVAEGFGKNATAQEEDDEMVEQKQVLIDGKPYTCECIEKDGSNFVKLRSLSQAGYTVVFDSGRQMPAVTAPQRRPFVPEASEEVQTAINKLQTVYGLEDQTMEYLLQYQYGDELVKKLVARME